MTVLSAWTMSAPGQVAMTETVSEAMRRTHDGSDMDQELRAARRVVGSDKERSRWLNACW
jgi:hypothetical protein